MTLRTLNYGNYGIFLIMGNAGFCPSTVRTTGCEWQNMVQDGNCSMRADFCSLLHCIHEMLIPSKLGACDTDLIQRKARISKPRSS